MSTSEDSGQTGHPPISPVFLWAVWVAEIQKLLRAVNKDYDQTEWMHRLVLVFDVCICHFVGFTLPGLRSMLPALFYSFEPCEAIMPLFVLRKLIRQTRVGSHPMGLDVWFLVRSFDFHISCVWTAKVLARLGGCAGSPEPSLVAYVISTIISWAGSFLKCTYTERGMGEKETCRTYACHGTLQNNIYA